MRRRQPRRRLDRKIRLPPGRATVDRAAGREMSRRQTLSRRHRLRLRSTNSTRWPESMINLSSISKESARSGPRPDLPDLISQLEKSLHAGQRALLRHDLEVFEEQTALQASLSRVLVESLGDWSSWENNLQAACSRVTHLCQVQLGLLRRAQRSLRMLSNLLAGAEGTYLPTPCPGVTGAHSAVSHKEG